MVSYLEFVLTSEIVIITLCLFNSTRDKESIQTACAFRRKDGSSSSVAKPVWISANSQTYYPSYNTAPQSNTLVNTVCWQVLSVVARRPVIISGGHDHVEKYFKTNDNMESSRLESNERVIQVLWIQVLHVIIYTILFYNYGGHEVGFNSVLAQGYRFPLFSYPPKQLQVWWYVW